MRQTITKALAAWSVVSIAIGVTCSYLIQRNWEADARASILQDAHTAALFVTSIPQGEQPIEASPVWKDLQERFDLAVLPLREPVARTDASPGEVGASTNDAASSRDTGGSSRETRGQLDPASALVRSGIGYRLSVDWPLQPSVQGIHALRCTRELSSPRLHWWWLVWAGLNAGSVGLAFIAHRSLTHRSEEEASLMKPWIDRVGSSAASETELLPIPDSEEAPLGRMMSGVGKHVNQTYAGVKNANDRSELVFRNLGEGVLAVDDQTHVLLANRALRRLLQITDAEYLNRPLLEVLRVPTVSDMVQFVLSHQEQCEEEIESGEQQEVFMRVQARPLPLGDNRVGALVTVRDETMLKRIERIRRDFVSNASHELKTPLAAIRAYAETLQMGAVNDPEAANRFLLNIISQVDRTDTLVQGMLQLARVEVGKTTSAQRFDALAALSPCIATIRPIASGKGVEVVEPASEHPLWIQSDRDGFQTIATNLLSNAVRYTDKGDTVTVRLSQESSVLKLEVEDTGVGIEAEDLERIFERFYRAHKDRAVETGGTGLGLAIVKHLAHALGGTVQANSRPQQGSTFVVELPVNAPISRARTFT